MNPLCITHHPFAALLMGYNPSLLYSISGPGVVKVLL